MELDLRKGNMKYYGRITIEIYLSMNLVRTIRKEDIQKQSRHVQRKEIKKRPIRQSKKDTDHIPRLDPVVWSTDGPVFQLGVFPRFLTHFMSANEADFHKHSPVSKLQSEG